MLYRERKQSCKYSVLGIHLPHKERLHSVRTRRGKHFPKKRKYNFCVILTVHSFKWKYIILGHNLSLYYIPPINLLKHTLFFWNQTFEKGLYFPCFSPLILHECVYVLLSQQFLKTERWNSISLTIQSILVPLRHKNF